MNDYMDDFVEKFSALGEGEESLRSLQHAIAVEREALTRAAKPRGSARREAAPSARFAIIAACAIVIVLLGAFALPRLFVPHTDPNTGDGIVSMRYRSTNENALLEGSRDRANVLPGQSPGTPMLSEITVGGENATLPDLYQLNLCVTAVAEGEDGGAVQLEAGGRPKHGIGSAALSNSPRRKSLRKGPWRLPRRLKMATR